MSGGMNPSATTAVRLGPGILGRKGYAEALTNRANRAGHIGLGAALRQTPPSVKELVEPEPPTAASLVSTDSIAVRLATDPSCWDVVLTAEGERPEGARPEVIKLVLNCAASLMPAELVRDLRDSYGL